MIEAPAIVALFVAEGGLYTGEPLIDAWPESRDARNYTGDLPVIAHPPCQLWTNLANVNFKRYGGEHNRPGNDGGCFASALASVRRCGGVLEHPAGSHAWPAHDIERPAPIGRGWALHRWRDAGVGEHGYWVCEVWQSAYGHKARKRTWLLYHSPHNGRRPPDLDWTQNPGTHQIGWFDRSKPTLSKREASATPPAFAEALIDLALKARSADPRS